LELVNSDNLAILSSLSVKKASGLINTTSWKWMLPRTNPPPLNRCWALSFSDLRATFTTSNYFLRSDFVCVWFPPRLPRAGGIRPGGAADGARVGTRVLTLPTCDLVKRQPCNQFSSLTPHHTTTNPPPTSPPPSASDGWTPHKLTVELDPRCRNRAYVSWGDFF